MKKPFYNSTDDLLLVLYLKFWAPLTLAALTGSEKIRSTLKDFSDLVLRNGELVSLI